MGPKDADRMANGVDPDQTAPLILDYIVCADLSVRKPRIITDNVTKRCGWNVNSVDPDLIWAQTCLSENLGSLWVMSLNDADGMVNR